VLSGEVAVPTERGLTFYVRHGELFAQCCAGVTAIALFAKLGQIFWRRGRGD
jgi:hypothetical protein